MCSNMKCSRFIVILFTSIFVLLGGVSLGLGIWVLVGDDASLDYLTRIPVAGESVDDALDTLSLLERSAWALVVVGGVILLLSIAGFLGACKKNKCLLYIYSIIMLVVLLAELAGAILAFLYWGEVEDNLKDFMRETLTDKYDGQTLSASTASGATVNDWVIAEIETVTGSWDFAQLKFKCCGVDSYNDTLMGLTAWTDKNYNTNDGAAGNPVATDTALIPPACCVTTDTNFKDNEITFQDIDGCIASLDAGTFNTEGCYDSVKDEILQYTITLAIVGIVVVLIQLTVFIAACCLIRAIKKDDEYV